MLLYLIRIKISPAIFLWADWKSAIWRLCAPYYYYRHHHHHGCVYVGVGGGIFFWSTGDYSNILHIPLQKIGNIRLILNCCLTSEFRECWSILDVAYFTSDGNHELWNAAAVVWKHTTVELSLFLLWPLLLNFFLNGIIVLCTNSLLGTGFEMNTRLLVRSRARLRMREPVA
jgi:hypothetical protein